MKIKVKKLHPAAMLPTYKTNGSIAFDIEVLREGSGEVTWTLHPGQSLAFRTGLAFEIPEGFGMLIHSRSGHGFNKGIRLANACGVIDTDYRGELMVKLHNDSQTPFVVKPGMAIAQGIVHELPRCDFILVDDLGHTMRGANGFGSTDLPPMSQKHAEGADSMFGTA